MFVTVFEEVELPIMNGVGGVLDSMSAYQFYADICVPKFLLLTETNV